MGEEKNSLLNNLTVIYNHLEEKRSGAIGLALWNIFYKELHWEDPAHL